MVHVFLRHVFAIFILHLPLQVAAEDAPECKTSDQLVCACEARGFKTSAPQWDACFLGDVNYATVTQVDALSARAFVALNWPVRRDAEGRAILGEPDFDATLSGDWTPVWGTWKATDAIFRGSAPPLPWDQAAAPLPAACAAIDVAKARADSGFATAVPDAVPPRLLDEWVNPDGHALLDARGTPIRYEITFNRQAYDYVASNGLWDPPKLEAYLDQHDALSFPAGSWNSGEGAGRGAIVIKTAWQVLTPEDDPTRFHKSWAYVTPVIEDGSLRHQCQLRPVGLVGMHIIYKTKLMPDWAWATFEHRDAAPLWSEIGATTAGVLASGHKPPDWLFYRNDGPKAARLNVPPKTARSDLPSRVTRFYPAGYYFGPVAANPDGHDTCGLGSQDFRCIAGRIQTDFADSVFANYILVGTQWREYSADGADSTLVPEILGNVAIETFSQSTSSCISCHRHAAPAGAAPKTFDFIFTFGRDVLERNRPSQIR